MKSSTDFKATIDRDSSCCFSADEISKSHCRYPLRQRKGGKMKRFLVNCMLFLIFGSIVATVSMNFLQNKRQAFIVVVVAGVGVIALKKAPQIKRARG